MAVATLKRLQNNFGAIVAKLLDIDRLGLQQIGLHADFLSIPPARYTGKAGEAPQRDASRQLAGKEDQLILICREGYSSSLAAIRLHELGLVKTTDVIGG